MEKRAFLIVLDSVGIGAMPDAYEWGDEGSNTLAAIRSHPEFDCPNLESFGLFAVDGVGIKLRTEDLPENFHVGITACEGIVRLYDMQIEQNKDESTEDQVS